MKKIILAALIISAQIVSAQAAELQKNWTWQKGQTFGQVIEYWAHADGALASTVSGPKNLIVFNEGGTISAENHCIASQILWRQLPLSEKDRETLKADPILLQGDNTACAKPIDPVIFGY